MKSGFRPYKWQDHRDYDFHRSFGSIAPAQFPLTFDVDAGFWMPNQNATLTYAIPGLDSITVPAIPYGCTDWTQADLCVDEDLKLYNPLNLEVITHANANSGGDVRVALEAARKVFGRTGYFNIKRMAGLDWYDSIRLVMLSTPEEKRAVSIGIPWLAVFENVPCEGADVGMLPTVDLKQAMQGAYTWHNAKIAGWNERGLKVKSWQGALYGDRGWAYMPRALVNQLMDVPGTCAFTLSKITPQQVFTIDVGYVAWFVSLIQNLIASFIKPSDTPVIAPVVPQDTPNTLPPTVPPANPKTGLLERFVQEIKTMEGWAPGTTSYANCNPGNLRCIPGQKLNWNILATAATPDNFCVFPTAEVGMQALRNVTTAQCKGLSVAYNIAAQRLGLTNSGELNLYQYFTVRDPSTDGNNPKALAERFAKLLNTDASTFKIKELLAG